MRTILIRTFLVVSAGFLSVRAAPLQQSRPSPEPAAKPIVEDSARFSVGPVPAAFGYDPTFYRKYVDGHGIPVISSEKVPDAALLVARDIVVYMLANRPDIRREWSNYEWFDGALGSRRPTI